MPPGRQDSLLQDAADFGPAAQDLRVESYAFNISSASQTRTSGAARSLLVVARHNRAHAPGYNAPAVMAHGPLAASEDGMLSNMKTAALTSTVLLSTAVPAQAQKPTTGYAPVRGLKMYYEIHGSGSSEPLVLLHGSFMTITNN